MATSPAERRESVLAALVVAAEAGVSGEQLARALSCSRAAVHRHVEALRRDGLVIHGEHEGYVLDAAADPVVPALVTPHLTGCLTGPVLWSATTGSTNDDVAAAARAGADEGLVIGADQQTQGRGRRGRPWIADANDALTFSVLLRPTVAPVDAGLLPLVVAVAVADALGLETSILWPNDIVMGGRKVCGILCESSLDEAGIAWAVAGIGVNVHGAPNLPDARWSAGHIGDGDARRRPQVLLAILHALDERYSQWLAGDGPGIVSAYARHDGLTGRQVVVETSGGRVTGIAAGIDPLGRLNVTTPSGLTTLGSGEVVRVSHR